MAKKIKPIIIDLGIFNVLDLIDHPFGFKKDKL